METKEINKLLDVMEERHNIKVDKKDNNIRSLIAYVSNVKYNEAYKDIKAEKQTEIDELKKENERLLNSFKQLNRMFDYHSDKNLSGLLDSPKSLIVNTKEAIEAALNLPETLKMNKDDLMEYLDKLSCFKQF